MFTPTQSLVNDLRDGFSAKKCAEAFLNVTTRLLAAIGVKVETKIIHIDTEASVKPQEVGKCINDMTAVMSAIMAGSRINVLTLWEQKNVQKPKSR